MLTPGRFEISPRAQTALLLIAVLGLGLFLRTFNLRNEDEWYDEIVTLEHLDAPSLERYLHLVKRSNPIHPPLYMILQYGWAQVFGPSENAARLLSVTAGMLCLLMMYALTRELYGSRAGLLSTLWLSFIPFHIYNAQEIRFYAFMSLFGIVSMYLFVKLVHDGRRRWWVLLSFADLAVIWTQPLGAAIFVSQAVYLIVFFRHRIGFILRWALQHLFICLTLLPFALSIDGDRGFQALDWLSRPKLFQPHHPSLEMFLNASVGQLNLLPTNRLGELIYPLKPALTGLLLLSHSAAAIFLVRAAMKSNAPTREATPPNKAVNQRQALGILLFWLLIPPLALFVISYLWRPIFLPRYLIPSMLPPYVLMAACLTLLSHRVRPYALAVLLIFNLGYQAAFHLPGPYRVRFDKAAEIVISIDSTRGPVAVHHPVDDFSMRYRLQSKGIRVRYLQTEKAFIDEIAGRDPDMQARWFVLTRPADTATVRRQLETAGRPYKEFDFTASRHLVVIYLEPRDAS